MAFGLGSPAATVLSSIHDSADMIASFSGGDGDVQHASSQTCRYINTHSSGGSILPTPTADLDLNGYTPVLHLNIPNPWPQEWSQQETVSHDRASLQQRLNTTIKFGQFTLSDDKISTRTKNSTNNVKRKHSDSADVSVRGAQQNMLMTGRKSSTASNQLREGSCGLHEDDSVKEPEEDAKREKFLKQNRIAASTCRRKKKEWTNALEEKLRCLQAEDTHLKTYTAMLREEVLTLKGEILNHQTCDCHRIRNHVAKQASNLAYHRQRVPNQSGIQPAVVALPTDSHVYGSLTQARDSISATQAQHPHGMRAISNKIRQPKLSQGRHDEAYDTSCFERSQSFARDINKNYGGFSDEDFKIDVITTMGEEPNVQTVK